MRYVRCVLAVVGRCCCLVFVASWLLRVDISLMFGDWCCVWLRCVLFVVCCLCLVFAVSCVAFVALRILYILSRLVYDCLCLLFVC